MIKDPFAVLQISPQASDAEIKKAYRALSKKWHPDQHPDDAEAAEEKFKEIQEAYRQIVEARERGIDPYGPQVQQSSAGQDGSGRAYADMYGDTSAEAFRQFFRQWQAYSEQMRSEQQAQQQRHSTEAQIKEAKMSAELYLQRGDYNQAMYALNVIEFAARDAEWYYLAALAHRGMGNNMTSLNYARQAADLEPDNGKYSALLRQMQRSGTAYQRQSTNYGGMEGLRTPNLWTTLCIANLLCNFCCRY